ncbi:MAG: hypothetical protein J0M18_02780 [Ignavibacteria bacterium]|nr:hypothetical protein [Ignavibacteria bacterium]
MKKESFPELNLDFDSDESWTNLKKAAKKIAYYPFDPAEIFSNYSRVTMKSVDKTTNDKISKVIDENKKIEESLKQSIDGMETTKEEYKAAVEEYEAALSATQDGAKNSNQDKLISINTNLMAASAKRVAKILTGNGEKVTRDSKWSDRGAEIFKGLKSNINEVVSFIENVYQVKEWYDILNSISYDALNPYYYLGAHINTTFDSSFTNFNPHLSFLFKRAYLINKMQSFNLDSMSSNLSNKLLQLYSPSDEGVQLHGNYSLWNAEDKAFMKAVFQDLDKKIVDFLKTVDEFQGLFEPLPTVAAMSAEVPAELSGDVSNRQARTAENGSLNLRGFNVNGAAGESIELGMPLFVQLKGDVSSSKSTEAVTGSVAYRLGNTVIGAIQGYANSGEGFGVEGRQLETSIIASQSFGAFFIEGQIGTVSATDVHDSNWKGMRSQVTLGIDTEFVSPFVQVAHRQLDRGGFDLNQTTAYVGVDMDVAKLKADSYTVDTRLLAKVGYGDKAWSKGTNDLGTTSEFSGSVEWSGTLSLNSGISFNASLNLDTTSKASASLQFSVEQ